MKVSPREFEKLVADALAGIPEEFRPYLANVEFIIRDAPDDPAEKLFGLYEGVPLTERSSEYSGFPDRIIIFRRPLLEEFDNPREIRREVTRTVLHEIAHHFGIDENRLAELGWD